MRDVLADVGDVEEAGFDAVVEVGGEVGDLVGEVDDLGFEGRALVEEVGGEVGVGGGGVVAGVLDDAFADGEGEVEAAVGGVALLEVLADAEGVEVVVEAEAVALEAVVEGALAGVAEGRVADVVDEGEGLGEVFVEAEAAATSRAICATSMVWVRRERKWSEAREVKTWVLPARRRKARDWTMRSRSRWKAVRAGRGGAG